jgi:hypothetical protein
MSGAGGLAAPALSLVHTLPFEEEESGEPGTYRVEIAEGGTAVRVREVREKRERKSKLVGVKRGRIRGMSKAASLRALFVLQSINQEKVKGVFFITQTAGPEFLGVNDWAAVERARRLWEKAFERKYGGDCACCFWKKEPHPSDNRPHLHRLLIWVVQPPSLVEFRAWDDQAWADALGAPLHRVRCSVELMRTWAGATFYLRKYIGKPIEGDEFGGALTGKCWDVRWRKNMPVRITETSVSAAVGVKMLRTLRRVQSRKREKWSFRPGPAYAWRRHYPVFSLQVSLNAPPVEFSDDASYRRYASDHFGWQFKRSRPSCMCRRVVKVWSMDDRSRKIELSGEEIEMRAFAAHFVPSSQARKLLEFCEKAVRGGPVAKLTSCELRWAVENGWVPREEIPF